MILRYTDRGEIEVSPNFQGAALAVPQIGWNGIAIRKPSALFADYRGEKLYFVHSYRALADRENRDWVLAQTSYGEDFISAVQKGRVAACQFHPDKISIGSDAATVVEEYLARGRQKDGKSSKVKLPDRKRRRRRILGDGTDPPAGLEDPTTASAVGGAYR